MVAVARRVADLGGSGFARLRTPDRERHCSARRGERTGGLDSDAGACAGDDCPFSMKADPANNLICGRTSAERDLHALVMDEREKIDSGNLTGAVEGDHLDDPNRFKL